MLVRDCILIYFYIVKLFFYKKNNNIILFGAPLLGLSYINKSIRFAGFNSEVLVRRVEKINKISDFDYVNIGFYNEIKKIVSSDIWVCYFDSFDIFFGFFRYCPKLIKKLFKIKLIVMPYGEDAHDYQLMQDYVKRFAIMSDYPYSYFNYKKIQRRINSFSDCADIIIGCLSHIDNLPRCDVLPVHYYPIDINAIEKLKKDIVKNPTFTIVHCPNHRNLKGTFFIQKACNELIKEGHEIVLKIITKTNNLELLKILHSSHLLIEQVIGGGYALNAMEGMACGLPVISHMNNYSNEVFKIYSYLDQCPIISCDRNVKNIKEKILFCKNNYDKLSKESTKYVRQYHSVEKLSIFWKDIINCNNPKELINYFIKE